MPIVADASPLIALTQIGRLDLLQALFTTVLMPPAVERETRVSVPSRSWLHVRPLTGMIDERIAGASLDAGETEAISLTLELCGIPVLLDERPARRLAQSLGLPAIGTLGVLLEAKRQGLVPELRSHLEALQMLHFFMAPGLVEQILSAAGES